MPSRLFDHSRQVAKYAAHLAELHGVDPDWIYIAGLYHDLGKTMDVDAMRGAAESERIAFDDMEARSASLLHAAASAALFQKDMKPPDSFVKAVRGHTVGAAPFGPEEQILYVADFAEPGRSYEECESVRRTAERDLHLATLEAVAFKMRFLMLRNKTIHARSLALYNFLLERPGRG